MSQSLYSFLVLVVMIVAFVVAYWLGKKKVPIGLYILFMAIVGALAGGYFIPIRHLVEGSFTFLEIVAIIISASFFIKIQTESKGIYIIVRDLISAFSSYTPLLLIFLMFFVMLPGAFTGSGTAAVMATGGVTGIVLSYLGLPKRNTTAFVAIGGVLGLTAPPINVPAMIIAAGINMPYMRFFLPLILLVVPLAIIFSLFFGAKYVERRIDPKSILEKLPVGSVRFGRVGAYFPLILVIGLFVFKNVFPGVLPVLGNPLIFVIGSISAILVSKKINIIENAKESISNTLPVCCILIAVGSLVQIMSLTGVKGFIVITAITAPIALVYIALMVGLPLSGSVLGTFGSSAAFGVPLMLALLGPNPIIEVTGAALICSLATLCPPSAIVGNAAIIVTNYEDTLGNLYRLFIVPAIVISVLGISIMIFSNELRWLVS